MGKVVQNNGCGQLGKASLCLHCNVTVTLLLCGYQVFLE